MSDLYDKDYLKKALAILRDNLNDLAKWSIYNGDRNLDEIGELSLKVKAIEKTMLKGL